jgi:hypothetical protein
VDIESRTKEIVQQYGGKHDKNEIVDGTLMMVVRVNAEQSSRLGSL